MMAALTRAAKKASTRNGFHGGVTTFRLMMHRIVCLEAVTASSQRELIATTANVILRGGSLAGVPQNDNSQSEH